MCQTVHYCGLKDIQLFSTINAAICPNNVRWHTHWWVFLGFSADSFISFSFTRRFYSAIFALFSSFSSLLLLIDEHEASFKPMYDDLYHSNVCVCNRFPEFWMHPNKKFCWHNKILISLKIRRTDPTSTSL